MLLNVSIIMFSDEYRILYVCGQSVLKLTFGNANKG